MRDTVVTLLLRELEQRRARGELCVVVGVPLVVDDKANGDRGEQRASDTVGQHKLESRDDGLQHEPGRDRREKPERDQARDAESADDPPDAGYDVRGHTPWSLNFLCRSHIVKMMQTAATMMAQTATAAHTFGPSPKTGFMV